MSSFVTQFGNVAREHVSSFTGTTVAWLAVITANQAQFEYWLRIASLFGALVASGFTVWGVIRKNRQGSA